MPQEQAEQFQGFLPLQWYCDLRKGLDLGAVKLAAMSTDARRCNGSACLADARANMAGFREWGKQQAKQGAGALHRLVKRVPGAAAAVRRTTCNAADIIGQKRTEWAQR